MNIQADLYTSYSVHEKITQTSLPKLLSELVFPTKLCTLLRGKCVSISKNNGDTVYYPTQLSLVAKLQGESSPGSWLRCAVN